MADVASGFRTYLLAQSAITNLIGSGASARFYPDELPQGCTMPACTYSKISVRHEHVIGSDWGRSGFAACRLEIECYALTRSQSSDIADTIMDYVCGPLGRLRGVYGNINFLDVMVGDGARTYADSPTDGSDDRRYVTVIEFMVNYFDD